MTLVQPFANYAEALDFALAESIRGFAALAHGDVEGAKILFESASRSRLIADQMHEAACR